ncbi:hypothetical protein [Bdellovibrio reynosensis]|uniref:Uncharacterized protein n=1 Tax=Bdellovibrio reynosensis TaxID=2835041 RepID=A0ABY4CGM0_9BACT|nr:hypothetical protein [Bdellovibrio reynosensis]UOF02951.1 hypothetical protein MNR06_08310 [Bdellovibrio reynosensis]
MQALKWLTYSVALSGLLIGYLGNPFGKKEPLPTSQEFEQLYMKSKTYFEVGNFEGVVDLSRKIPKDLPPKYSDIREFERRSKQELEKYKKQLKEGKSFSQEIDRLPAALRDSYFDAQISAQSGRCREAYDHMSPVSRYLGNREDLKIFRKCRLTEKKSY